MTNSELFKLAHRLAKKYIGHYSACFALALKTIRNPVKKVNTIMKEVNVIKKNRKFFKCEIGGYPAKIVINENSENLKGSVT